MYKMNATTREDYLKEASDSGRSLDAIDAFIQGAAPSLRPWFYNVGPKEPGMTFKMVAYGAFTYVPTKDRQAIVEWPVIGLALQKNYISLYVSVTKDHKPLVDFYADRLNYTRRGNNNFSFESFEQLNKPAFEEFVKETARIFSEDPRNPVRFKEGTTAG